MTQADLLQLVLAAIADQHDQVPLKTLVVMLCISIPGTQVTTLPLTRPKRTLLIIQNKTNPASPVTIELLLLEKTARGLRASVALLL